MRAAMARAEVGDDSFGDDPTVTRLEARGAELLGTEQSLFTCSGTMSNLLAVLATAGSAGGTVVAGSHAHLLHHENDGVRVLARARVQVLADPHGELDPADVAAALADRPARSVLWLENTSNLRGGHAQDEPALDRQAAAGRRAGAWIHLDGARLANAAVAVGRPVAALARMADSVAFSLCKGLGAPAGSLLGGSAEFVREARWLRRMVGGTMHQAGVLAAAGLLALDRLPALAEDHRRAATLRDLLKATIGVELVAVPRPTNMVFFRVRQQSATELVTRLAAVGVLGLPVSDDTVRLVVHHEHTDDDIQVASGRIANICGGSDHA
jgi:threonine aldolase